MAFASNRQNVSVAGLVDPTFGKDTNHRSLHTNFKRCSFELCAQSLISKADE